ncbi:MAG TPA: hypothetical protein VLP43_10930 [Solirubrobacteraceae bacterium]|nr:hypothetical protein [Solirubrobacteraceae bacterium]
MPDLLLAAGLTVAASWLLGTLLLGDAAARCPAVVAPAGFATLLVLGGVLERIIGTAAITAVWVWAIPLLAAAAWRIRRRVREVPASAVLAGLLAAAGALVPFLCAGRVGILGVGTNNDMSEHLLTAWVLQHGAPASGAKLLSSGYPVAPHILVAMLAHGTGMPTERAFTGLTIAVPVLMSWTAAALLPRGGRLLRGALGAGVGLCYLQAAFLAQASFKEPIEALLVLGTVAVLPAACRPGALGDRVRIVLAVLAAAGVYTYSYPSLAWIGGPVLLVSIAERVRRSDGASRQRLPLRAALLPLAGFGLLIAPEIPRIVSFLHSGYNNEGSSVLGDLLHPLSPLEATGIWPSLDFRFAIPLASSSGILALAISLAAMVAVGRGLVRREYALPAALITALVMWGFTSLRSPYTAAKSLAILAPLVTLVVAAEASRLLADRAPGRWRRLANPAPGSWRRLANPAPGSWGRLAAGLVLGGLLAIGALSDLRVLRDAPVGPAAHSAALARLQPLLGRGPALFLGADDFVAWELRGTAVATPPQPLYARMVVPLRRTKARTDDPSLYDANAAEQTFNRFAGLGLAFDFDSVPTRWLDAFRFVIAPSSGYASTPPANWRAVRRTPEYVLWRRTGPTAPHLTLAEGGDAGAVLDCRRPSGRAIAAATGQALTRPMPVIAERWSWRGRMGVAGSTARLRLRLPAGRWSISLQYASTVPLTVTAAAHRAHPTFRRPMPASLERLGPYWLVGQFRLRRAGPITFALRYRSLPLAGRLLGAAGQTRPPAPTGLSPRGRLVATRADVPVRRVPLHRACGQYVDWYTFG